MDRIPRNVDSLGERLQALTASPRVRRAVGGILLTSMTLGLAGSQAEHEASSLNVHTTSSPIDDMMAANYADSFAIVLPPLDYVPNHHETKLQTRLISHRERLVANPHEYHDEAVAFIGGGNVGGIWELLRNCEGSYTSAGKYFGAYQFLVSTWNNLAAKYRPDLYGVRPDHASPADQDYMGMLNEAVSGFGQYPKCSRDNGFSRNHPEYFNIFLGIYPREDQMGDEIPQQTTTSTTQPSPESTTTTTEPQQTTTTSPSTTTTTSIQLKV
jgi:hypothetical protein